MKNIDNSRRRFIQGGTGLLAAGGVSSFVPKLNMMGTALAQSATTGYKAVVCLYLGGGSDSWNMLIPTETNAHNEYVQARNGLYTQANPNGLGIPLPGTPGGTTLPGAIALTGAPYGVNPFAPELATLYNQGALSFLSNVGTLVRPLTRARYNNRPKPPQLYSHNDQTNLWFIGGGPNSNVQQGWGGRVAGTVALPSSSTQGLPPAISIAGSSRFLVGETLSSQPIFPFQMSSTTGNSPATSLSNYSLTGSSIEAARRTTLEQLFGLAYPQAFSAEYRDIFNRSLDLADRVINPRVASIPAGDPVLGGGATGFTWPTTGLGNQLRQVARMIRISRNSADAPGVPPITGGLPINANRQVFYVSAGGYDTHDGQITSPTLPQGHHNLLAQLSAAVNAFYRAMVAIGAQNQVVLFTMSDFGRTINSNGNGTDHAWGSVQCVVGGPQATGGPIATSSTLAGTNTAGSRIFGNFPVIHLDNRVGGTGAVSPQFGECFNRGQMLPTIATDQMGATLARWMGVDDANLPLIFPNIDNFTDSSYDGGTPMFSSFTRTIPFLV